MAIEFETEEVRIPGDPLAEELAAEQDAAPAEEDDREEVQSLLARALEEAIGHYEENLEPDQVKATEYYYGRPFGDEQEGRSKVVSTDVRDAVQAQLPSLMRIFFGSERPVEFVARPSSMENAMSRDLQARQATDYILYVIQNDNDGFLTFYNAFKDALVRRTGYVKWWNEDFVRVEGERHDELSAEQLALLMSDPEVTLDGDPEPYRLPGSDQIYYRAKILRKKLYGCPKIEACPPEEIVWTPDARSLKEAPLVAHVREVPRDELIAMGIDPEIVENKEGRKRATASDHLEDVRQFHGGNRQREMSDERDDSQAPVLFAEAYFLIDRDGDGIAERRKFLCIGDDFEIVGDPDGEVVDGVPIACFTPDPEPHTIVGLGDYDFLRDIQRVKSHVIRAMMDSLALAVEPRTEVVQGEVNMQDLLNPEMSSIIRVRKPGMMREVGHTFVGKEALGVLAYWDEIKENRTGQTKAAMGLDADALQSATKAAVAATLSASQQRIELIARVFAEQMREVFRGLLKLVVRHQNRSRIIRLRGQYVEMDPRSWDADMDVHVRVALGAGSNEDRLRVMGGLLSEQKELMQIGAPFVSWAEIRNTLARITELAGEPNPDIYWKPWGAAQEEQMQQAMAMNPPPPDPAQQLVEIERMKVELDATVAQAKAQMEEWKLRMEDDRERDRMAREFAYKEAELQLKHQAEVNRVQIEAQVARDRAAMDADVKREKAALDAEARRAAANQGGVE